MANKQTGVQYMSAKTAFMVGETLKVRKGDIFAADDPVVEKYPTAFEPFEQRVRDTRQR